MRPITAFLAALLILSIPARAQAPSDGMAARLSAEKLSDIEPGLYAAGESRTFTLTPAGDRLLLRFADSPEVFALTVERASLGAKVLKYDTGATALRVSVWGGLTLYTQADPSGLPATRRGDAPVEALPAVSSAALNAALEDEAAHLNYTQKMSLRFSAEGAVMTADDAGRAAAFAALTNAARGIERFLAAAPARKAMAGRLDGVKLLEGPRPQVAMAGRTLTISFAPGQGAAGIASSQAVAHALGRMLAVVTAE